MSQIAERLSALGVTLPRPAAPVANYVPAVRTGALLVVSGQLPLGPDGKLASRHIGKLGPDSGIDAAREAARLAAINVLAQAQAALGDLDANPSGSYGWAAFSASPPASTRCRRQ